MRFRVIICGLLVCFFGCVERAEDIEDLSQSKNQSHDFALSSRPEIICKDGEVRHKSGRRLGSIGCDEVRSTSGQLTGTKDGNRVRDRSGRILLEVDRGKIRDRSGRIIAEIDSQGRVRDRSGRLLEFESECTILFHLFTK